MKKAIAILLIAVLALTCFAACGKKDDDKAAVVNPEGVYTAKTMNDKPIEDALMEEMGDELEGVSIDTLLSLMGVSSMDALFSLEIKDDGTFSITAMGDAQEGTWTQDGNKLTMTIDGDAQEATLNGNELTFQDDDLKLVFVKQ